MFVENWFEKNNNKKIEVKKCFVLENSFIIETCNGIYAIAPNEIFDNKNMAELTFVSNDLSVLNNRILTNVKIEKGSNDEMFFAFISIYSEEKTILIRFDIAKDKLNEAYETKYDYIKNKPNVDEIFGQIKDYMEILFQEEMKPYLKHKILFKSMEGEICKITFPKTLYEDEISIVLENKTHSLKISFNKEYVDKFEKIPELSGILVRKIDSFEQVDIFEEEPISFYALLQIETDIGTLILKISKTIEYSCYFNSPYIEIIKEKL